MNTDVRRVDVSVAFLSGVIETRNLDALITVGEMRKRYKYGQLMQAKVLLDRAGIGDIEELSENTKVSDLLDKWSRLCDPQVGFLSLTMFPPPRLWDYDLPPELDTVGGTTPPQDESGYNSEEQEYWGKKAAKQQNPLPPASNSRRADERTPHGTCSPASSGIAPGLGSYVVAQSVTGDARLDRERAHSGHKMSSLTFQESGDTGKQPLVQSSHQSPWPAQAPIDPLPVFELTTPAADWIQEAADLVGAQALASLTEQWSRLFASSDPFPEFSGLNYIFLEIINAAAKTAELQLTRLTEAAMLKVLCGDKPLGERYSLLQIQPICGLAVCAAGESHPNSLLRDAIDSAPGYADFLPWLRDNPPGSTDIDTAVDEVMKHEKGALGALLQPVLALVRMASQPGDCGDPLQAARDMSVSLQALERATLSIEHDGVLKGLVVESATSARLVLLVQNPLDGWECWASPSLDSVIGFVSCAVLTALVDGRQLADRMLQRDRVGNGPAWQAQLRHEVRLEEIRALEAEEIARDREESERERREARAKSRRCARGRDEQVAGTGEDEVANVRSVCTAKFAHIS